MLPFEQRRHLLNSGSILRVVGQVGGRDVAVGQHQVEVGVEVEVDPGVAPPGEGRRVSETILAAIQATRQVVATNTNLGIVLLLAQLAAVPRGETLRPGGERIRAEGVEIPFPTAVRLQGREV